MMAMRGQSASASSMLCVVRITLVCSSGARPSAFTMSDTICQISRRATGSTPVEHSSKNTICGCPIVAHANDRRRFIPPLYPMLNRSLSKSLRPTSASFDAAASLTTSLGTPLILAYSSTCSRPVMLVKWASNCGQYPTRRRVFSGSRDTLNPARVASPVVGGNSAVSIPMVVVFPAPFIPSNEKHWPGGIPSEMLFTAIFPLL
mmetsp:Transcript_11562/g.33249  ORF Transcript_11562/g.33249 Transcript_11562/m.33249 type:complete len:204 (+) Transcript_11562:1130-1741(+)